MNIREFFGSFVGAFVMTGALMFLFHKWFPTAEPVRTEFIAPASQAHLEPLYTSIDFDKNVSEVRNSHKDLTVTTSYGEFTFSSYGAALSKIVLYQGKDKRAFTVCDYSLSSNPTYAPLLVALDKDTPWEYTLHDLKEDDSYYSLTFTAKSLQASLIKTYWIDKSKNKIDVQLTVNPLKGASVRTRLVWPTPLLNTTAESLKTQQLVRIDSTGNFKKYPLQKLNEQMGFFNPTFFGVESKYFVASYFQAEHTPVDRAYCKVINNILYAFIESNPVTTSTTTAYSFVFMPKDMNSLYAEIAPLEKTFDYGFFSLFTKLMIHLLRIINTYIRNYGWSIIILTTLLKLFLLPFTYNHSEKMKRITENERRLHYLLQKNAHDPEAIQRIREEHVRESFSALLGTQWPLFIQMPFIIGLSGVINNSLEFCGAPFIGWITDLSMPDKYGVLPSILGLVFFLNLISTSKMTFRKFVGFVALTLFGIGFVKHFSTAFLLFFLVTMIFHVGQTFIVERVKR